MSKIFGTIAAVLLAASAFIAWKNLGAYKDEITANTRAEAINVSTTEDLKKQQKRITDAEEAEAQHIASAEEAQKKLGAATAEFENATETIASLKQEHKNNEDQVTTASEALSKLPDPEELIPKIKDMRDELALANSGIATAEARLAKFAKNDKETKEKIATLRDLIDRQSSGKSFPTLNTTIRSVYRSWGFVILAAGDNQGVVSGSILDVLRGDEVIGKLKVTAVETGRASADIVLGSVAEEVTLRSGDKVVAESLPEEVAGTPAP